MMRMRKRWNSEIFKDKRRQKEEGRREGLDDNDEKEIEVLFAFGDVTF